MTKRTECEVYSDCKTCGGDTALKIQIADIEINNIHNDSLLFRIYDKELKMLYYPEFSEIGVTFGPSPDGRHYPKDASDYLFDICCWDGTRYVADKCTGLKDRAQHMIYENDEFELDKTRYRIIYIERNASFFIMNLATGEVMGMNDEKIKLEDISICGNIHNV